MKQPASPYLKIFRKVILVATLLWTGPNTGAQTLCEPFYIIGESNKGKIWEAIFGGCIDMQLPLLKNDNDPAVAAKIYSKRKIKKVTCTHPERKSVTTEYFDEQGYEFFTGSDKDTSSGHYSLPAFNENKLLSLVTLKDGYSLSGVKGAEADTVHSTNAYSYDASGRLIEKKETRLNPIKKYRYVRGKEKIRYYRKPRKEEFITTIIFDKQGNIIAEGTSQGSRDTFVYDAAGRLLTVADITKNLANGETWHFGYNKQYLVDTIRVSYKDSGTFKPYKICLAYNEQYLLTGLIKYYADGTIWREVSFDYRNGLLTGIKDCIAGLSSCYATTYDYDGNGLIRQVTKFRGGEQTDRFLYTYEFYP